MRYLRDFLGINLIKDVDLIGWFGGLFRDSIFKSPVFLRKISQIFVFRGLFEGGWYLICPLKALISYHRSVFLRPVYGDFFGYLGDLFGRYDISWVLETA